MGIGLGYGRATTSAATSAASLDATYAGPGPAFELLLGGTLGSGLVLGAGLLELDIINPNVNVTANPPSPSNAQGSALGFNTIGPFIDWFPDVTGGAHVGAMFGLGIIHLKDDMGISGSVWGGYDVWVGQQWSLGTELRATALRGWRDLQLGVETAHFDDSAATLELLFTALLH